MTDLTSGRIIREQIDPDFKKDVFDSGMEKGVDAVIKVIKGEFEGHTTKEQPLSVVIIFILIFAIFWIMAYRNRKQGRRHSGNGLYWYPGGPNGNFDSGPFGGGFSGGGGSSGGGGASSKF